MQSGLLEIKNIKKRFGEKEALRGVSLTLYPGETLTLLGVNGAGKTTLSSIVATLKPPTEGDILFQGVSIYNNIPWYRLHLGFCPQKPNLNPFLTLEDNLLFAGRYFNMPANTIEKRIEQLSEQFHLGPYLKMYAPTLSGGYKQRFMLARSLIHSPNLLILDEPTVALDPNIRHQLWDLIQTIKQAGTTILLTTHYLEEAEVLSDRVCLLDRGTVHIVDTPTNLLSFYKKSRLEDVFIHFAKESGQL